MVSIEVSTSASTSRLGLIRRVVSTTLQDCGVENDAAVEIRFAVDAICSSVIACSSESAHLTCRLAVGRREANWQVASRLVPGMRLDTHDFGWQMVGQMVEDVSVADDPDADHVEVSCRKLLPLAP